MECVAKDRVTFYYEPVPTAPEVYHKYHMVNPVNGTEWSGDMIEVRDCACGWISVNVPSHGFRLIERVV